MANVDDSLRATDNFTDFSDGVYRYSERGPQKISTPGGNPLKNTLEILYSEHRYISSVLDTLEQQAQRLTPGSIPDYNLLLDILDYLVRYPDQFHHPREDILFSHILESDSKFQSKLARLSREHETLRYYNNQLFSELTGIADGRPVKQDALQGSIQRYVEGYRRHMDFESRQVFPLARGQLSATEVERLESKTRYRDDPLFGGQVQKRYRRLGRQVQARAGIASQQLLAREMDGIESLVENLTGAVDILAKVGAAVSGQSRDGWREQVDTIRKHARIGDGPSILFLPFALIKNRRRQIKEGVVELRQILVGRGQQAGRSGNDPSGGI